MVTRNIKSKTHSTIPILISLFDKKDNPLDLSNAEFFLTVRENPESDVVIECSTRDGSIKVLQPGVVEIRISADKATKPGVFVYDVLLRQPDFQRVILEGTLTLELSISRQ